MTWLWVIIAVVILVFIVSYLTTGNKNESMVNAAGAGFGCGYFILQIFLTLLCFWVLFQLGKFLFG